jgi:hypothetical protein
MELARHCGGGLHGRCVVTAASTPVHSGPATDKPDKDGTAFCPVPVLYDRCGRWLPCTAVPHLTADPTGGAGDNNAHKDVSGKVRSLILHCGTLLGKPGEQRPGVRKI